MSDPKWLRLIEAVGTPLAVLALAVCLVILIVAVAS